MYVTIEFARLFLSRPPADAPDAVVADWYDAKAAVHQAIAAQEVGLAAARERGYAKAARDHARALRRGSGSQPSAA